MQMVGRERAAAILKLPTGGADGGHVELHMRLFGRPATFFKIARQTGGRDIFPAGDAAKPARNNMVKGQVIARTAILAFKLVPQKQVETRKGGVFGRFDILAKRYDGRDLYIEVRAVDVAVIAGNDIDLVQKHRLDRGLPRPKAQRIIAERGIIGIEHQRRAIFRMPGPACRFERSGMQHKSDLLPLLS